MQKLTANMSKEQRLDALKEIEAELDSKELHLPVGTGWFCACTCYKEPKLWVLDKDESQNGRIIIIKVTDAGKLSASIYQEGVFKGRKSPENVLDYLSYLRTLAVLEAS